MNIGVLRIGIQRIVLLQVCCAFLSVSLVLHGSTTSSLPPLRARPIGLTNGGNFCYMNAMFQALMVTPFFYSLHRFAGLCKENKDLTERNTLMDTVLNFYTAYNEAYNVYDMQTLYKMLLESYGVVDEAEGLNAATLAQARQEAFENGRQGDAHEMLVTIVSTIERQNKTCKNVDTPYTIFVTEAIGSGEPKQNRLLPIIATPDAENLRVVDIEVSLQKTFLSKADVVYGNKILKKETKITEPLPDFFIIANALVGNNATLIGTKKEMRTFKGVTNEYIVPDWNYTPYKITTCIIPEWIDLAPYGKGLKAGTDTIYRLASLVLHGGGTSGGHYIAYVRYGTTWYECNDTTITPREQLFAGSAGRKIFTGNFLPTTLFYVRESGSRYNIERFAQQLNLLTLVTQQPR